MQTALAIVYEATNLFTQRQTTSKPHRLCSNILKSLPQSTNGTHYKKHILPYLIRAAFNNFFHDKILDTSLPDKTPQKDCPSDQREYISYNFASLVPTLITQHLQTSHRQLLQRFLPLFHVNPHTVTHLIVDCRSLAPLDNNTSPKPNICVRI